MLVEASSGDPKLLLPVFETLAEGTDAMNPEETALLFDSGSRIKSGMTPSFAEDLISIPPRAELRLHASGLPNTKHQCFNL